MNDGGVNALGEIIIAAEKYHPAFNKMFPFLLDAGINVKPTGASLDPLNLAIGGFQKNSVFVEYAELLIQHGAPIEFSHRQQIETLKLSDEETYADILYHIPSLSVDG